MNDLARLVVEASGSPSRIVHVPYDQAYEDGFEDMKRRVPDIARIRTLTGWEPTRGLETIIADVIEHQRVAAADDQT